jgi:DNA-binding MurR/RpiR family transcriptional regulator
LVAVANPMGRSDVSQSPGPAAPASPRPGRLSRGRPLQQLLADRERLHAATDLQPWARAHAAPPDEQVTQVRDLIRRIEADMDALSDADRAQIRQAVTAIRAARQSVMLGMPAVRPAAADR